MEVVRQAAGEVVLQDGTEGQDFHIIQSGQVKVLRKGHGREPRPIAALGPGDFFGEGALLYSRRRSATIEAATDLELLRLGKDAFDALVRRFPRMRPNLLLTHESHELYRQTKLNWLAPYITGGFGLGLALTNLVVAYVFWRMRPETPLRTQAAQAQPVLQPG